MAEGCCRDCSQFVRDTVGDGFGVGRCLIKDEFLAVPRSRADVAQLYERLGLSLDHPIVWGGPVGRECFYYRVV